MSGLWVWIQPHCKCGWIGTEHDNVSLTSTQAALLEFDGHRDKECPLEKGGGSE